MRHSSEDYIQFIIVNGFYPEFVKFCSTIPSVKSKKRKCYLFLRKMNLFKVFSIVGVNNIYQVCKVNWL